MSANRLAGRVDNIVRLIEEHQRVSTLRDACRCGAGDMNTLLPTGTATTRHWRHLALVIAQSEEAG